MRLQRLREQRRQVKPFPRRSPEHSVVRIEPVYVEELRIADGQVKAGTSEEALRLAVETARGVVDNPGVPDKPAAAWLLIRLLITSRMLAVAAGNPRALAVASNIAMDHERLQAISPEGTANRNYVTREIAARTVFVMLYIGAVEGAECWRLPDQVTRMTDTQAALARDLDQEAWLAESMCPAVGYTGYEPDSC